MNRYQKGIVLLYASFFILLHNINVANAEEVVWQTERSLPVVRNVDLLVIGGSTGAVAAAVEAAQQGVSVFLVTSHPYLGEDRTATLRLGGEVGEDGNDPLGQALLEDKMRSVQVDNELEDFVLFADRLDYKYTISGNIGSSHGEVEGVGRLRDKFYANPVQDSLQINGNGAILVDLGAVKEFQQITLLTFMRRERGPKQFGTAKVTFSASTDNKNWTSPVPFTLEKKLESTEKGDDIVPFQLLFPQVMKTRYLKLELECIPNVDRLLLGELIILARKYEKQVLKDTEKKIKLPRPLHIKYLLDETLLKANVPFLYNTFVGAPLSDEQGTTVGMEIINRSGRQAIIAKKILDARPKIRSLKEAQFVVIGARAQKPDLKCYPLLKEVRSETLGESFYGQRKKPGEEKLGNEFPIINYRITVNVPEGITVDNLPFRAKVEEQIRLALWSPDQAFTADEIYYDQEFISLDQWRKKGRTLAQEAKKMNISGNHSGITVQKRDLKNGVETIIPGDICETYPVKRYQSIQDSVKDPERCYPVLGTYDVVVVGGGTSGAPAGIAAGRLGAKTLVIEHLHDLGGTGTAGAIASYWYGNVTGFTKEVQDGLRRWPIESRIHWWRSHLAQAGSEVWYGILGIGALVDAERVRGVLVATPNGIGIIRASIIIDATGNGDIAVAAGAKTFFIDDREISVQGAGLAPRNLGADYTNTDFMFVDENDIMDGTHVFVYAKEKYPDAFDQGKLLGTRERRQIIGDFCFTALDQINGRTYPDSIVYSFSDYDTHGFTTDPYMDLNHPHPLKYHAYVPYRSCIPKGLDGIFVVGLAMSCHRDALPIVRMQPDLQNQGYAIGVAAAMLAPKPRENIRNLDIRNLQKHLVDIGNLESEVMKHEDNYGKDKECLPQWVRTLPERFREDVSRVLWYPEQARPLVRAAYLQENDFNRKFIYAKTAATLGDPIGADTIIKKIEQMSDWDKGWDFRGMGQAGAATSPLDQWILMLGRTKAAQGLEAIIAKTKLLTAKSEFSHFRAVAIALESIGGPRAADALAKLLDKPDITGYVHDSIEKAKEFDRLAGKFNTTQEAARRNSLVEISVARALYRCGDVDGKGEAILRAYTNDLRGHFARHAREILKFK